MVLKFKKNLTEWDGNVYTAYQTGTVERLKAVLETKGGKLNGDPKQYVVITETFVDNETVFSQPEHLCHVFLRLHSRTADMLGRQSMHSPMRWALEPLRYLRISQIRQGVC